MHARSRKTLLIPLAAAFTAIAAVRPAMGQVPVLLHSQPPGRTFGYTSDTAYTDDFGQQRSALYADRFVLSNGGEACKIDAFAFFGTNYEPFDPPPPANETIGVKFFSDSSGQPGAELLSQTFVNPPRTLTGFRVDGDPLRKEYRYELNMNPCFPAAPGVAYWVSTFEILSPEARWRWEGSNTPGEVAQQYPIGGHWIVATTIGQLAYELWTPEPSSIVLIGSVGIGALMRRRPRRRRDR
jgi:hypothetical protein